VLNPLVNIKRKLKLIYRVKVSTAIIIRIKIPLFLLILSTVRSKITVKKVSREKSRVITETVAFKLMSIFKFKSLKFCWFPLT